MTRFARSAPAIPQAAAKKNCEILREHIPLRDMSDCLLAVYDEVSRRALQRGVAGGARAASDQENWKAAENDLFARISVDFEESGANLYALASLPGCVGGEITVAVDESWLLISGYAEHGLQAGTAAALADGAVEGAEADYGDNESASETELLVSGEWAQLRGNDERCEIPSPFNGEEYPTCPASCVGAPRPFCVVALRAKVDPGRSVAVLSNGLLAIRMGKAPAGYGDSSRRVKMFSPLRVNSRAGVSLDSHRSSAHPLP